MHSCFPAVAQWMRSRQRSMKYISQVFVIVGFALLSLPALAQNGQITGTAKDQHGAAVVGAGVQVMNLSIGNKFVIKTGSDGIYTINRLAPGKYELTVIAPGFSVYDSGVVSLAEGQKLTVDALLEVASVQSVVQVNGNPDLAVGPLPQSSLSDLPYSINSVPDTIVQDAQVHRPDDLFRINPFVKNMWPESRGNPYYVVMRGFGVNSMALDGLSFRDYNVDLDDIDHVEFLTGLSGFLYGFEDPGGMVNYVLKRPTAMPIATLTASSFGGKNGALHGDFGGPIGKSRKFGYRLNVMGEDGDTPVQNQTEMHGLATGVLDWHVTDKALIEVNGSWTRRDDEGAAPFWIISGAYPAPPDPRKLWGEKWGNSIYYRVREGARLTWDLNSIFSVRAAFNYTVGSGKSISVNNRYTAGDSTYSQSSILWAASRLVTETGGIYLDARFKTKALHHTATMGFSDYNYISYLPTDDYYSSPRVYGFSLTTPTYIDKPNHAFVKGPKHEYFDQGHRAAFVSDRIEWQRWTAILGVNHATAIDTDHNVAAPYNQTDSYSKATFAPTASLIYKPIDRVSTYFTYMQGLEPGEVVPSWYTNAGQVFAPMIDRQYELGTKATAGRALFTAALFNIDKANAVTLADGSYAQKVLETHRGAEISVSGKTWNDLVLYGGLTLMSPVVTKDPSLNGKRPTDASRELAKIFAEYPIHAVRGLAINGGVFQTGNSYADSDNTVKLPAYTTEDLGVHYELKRERPVTFRFNVTNLTNKAYWMSSRFTGAPRNFNFGVEYKLF